MPMQPRWMKSVIETADIEVNSPGPSQLKTSRKTLLNKGTEPEKS